MKKKIQLDDIDVEFDPTPLTEEEKKGISEYIRKYKAKGGKKSSARKQLNKNRVKAIK